MLMEKGDGLKRVQVVAGEPVHDAILLLPVVDGAFVHGEVLLLQVSDDEASVHDDVLLLRVSDGVLAGVPLVLASGEASAREPVLARELVLPLHASQVCPISFRDLSILG